MSTQQSQNTQSGGSQSPETRRDGGRKPMFRLRPVLLASVAALGIAAVIAGPGDFSHGFFGSQGPTPARAAAASGQQPVGFADLVARVKPAVISVRVRIDEASVTPDSPFYKFFGGSNQKQGHQVILGEGSGFFISADGYAVTNNHVVDHSRSVQVTANDGTIYTAKVVGTDPKSDLALLKVDADKPFPFVKFATQKPRVGDWVVAVGNPFGLGGTVTAGIVSASGRDIGSNPYDDYLQIDAPINKGNSGGPAFNTNGNVIGVNTAIYSPSGGSVGIGFDIPAATVKLVVNDLKEKGYVIRGWLGVQIQPVTPGIAESLDMKQVEGALVDQPEPNSPAASAGIKAGDVITAVNGAPVKDPRTLAQSIATVAPGTSVKVTLWRDGASTSVDLKLAEMPKPQQQANAQEPAQHQPAKPQLGLRLAPARDVGGLGGEGVAVVGVDPDGPAAQTGVQGGDVILDVSGKSVQTPADVREAIDATRSQGRHDVLMRVKTPQGTTFVAIPVANG